MVISADKSDILAYYGGSARSASICYTVQPQPAGLCDALFRALPVIDPDEPVVVGLPDTIWFPADGLASLDRERFSFLLFPVEEPQYFDSVERDADGRVSAIRVKAADATSHWIWGAFQMPGRTFQALFDLWKERGEADEYVGTLVNAWIKRGGVVYGVAAGESYYDVGTMEGYLETMKYLTRPAA
jgi:dTDP-glucose pyrophosphorylase